MAHLTPLHDCVVVRQITLSKDVGEAFEGELLEVSQQAREAGLRTAQRVLFDSRTGLHATVDGVDVLILATREVLAVVERNGDAAKQQETTRAAAALRRGPAKRKKKA